MTKAVDPKGAKNSAAKHAAMPQEGINAIQALLELLAGLPLENPAEYAQLVCSLMV